MDKKKRNENWSSDEKDILRQLVANSANIIENKENKASVNMMKVQAWKDITKSFNEVSGKKRSDVEVKMAWKRMKLAAKANLSTHRQQLVQTGGGEKPPSPSQADQEIMAIAPYDFINEQNIYDSDGPQTIEMIEICSESIDIPSQEAATVNIPDINALIDVPDNFQDDVTTQAETVSENQQNQPSNKKTTTTSQIKNNAKMKATIVESNLNYKKRSLEMLEDMHEFNKKIAHLKIKKLQLEIELLQKK